jgi:alkanesulfonate monooxygenase SsuD/methylene tetrahydromethanopterin reductase-like flavin-dependent oxidoreductase (luciferase family)
LSGSGDIEQSNRSVTPQRRLTVGIVLQGHDLHAFRGRLSELASAVTAAGIDHVTFGDHVSFAGGQGGDGLIQATALLAAHPTTRVQTGVYLLSLRHPATVARQLATISLVAPGRFTFGVGLGGDDPRELELCGVDPRSRGARMNEALTCVRRFMTGDEVEFRGRFFTIDGAAIRPAPEPPIPVLVGGRSDAALVRTARLGDGWIAVWVSPRRFAAATEMIRAAAVEARRDGQEWLHTMQLWAGFDSSRERAIDRISAVMERAYQLPFERFERYTPCGRPGDVAAALEPYVAAGCRRFNFVPVAHDLDGSIAAIAAVKRALEGG